MQIRRTRVRTRRTGKRGKGIFDWINDNIVSPVSTTVGTVADVAGKVLPIMALGGLGKRKRRPARRGRGFFDTLKGIHNKVKTGRVISNALGRLGYQKAASVAKTLGYGRRRRRPARRGRGFFDTLKNIHNKVKSGRVISSTLGRLGYQKAASVASRLGYGRRRHPRRGRGFEVMPSVIPQQPGIMRF